MTHGRFFVAGGLSLALLAGACHEDELFSPLPPQYAGGAMFQRYVAMGNSITAGFQSGGFNDSTQKQSYALLLATAMGSQYYYPSFTMPGCPPPIDTLFTASGVPHTLGAPLAPPCALRSPTIPPYLTNVAVPGATTFDPVSTLPTVSSNALTLFILGGRSQVEAAADAHPTFLSVWIGNNDVLGAATDQTNAGDRTKVTPVALRRSIGVAIPIMFTIGNLGFAAAEIAPSVAPRQYPKSVTPSAFEVRSTCSIARGRYSSQYVSSVLPASLASGTPQSSR